MSNTPSMEPTKWENGWGDVRWQPTLGADRYWRWEVSRYWRQEPRRDELPVLCRWKWWAKAAARAEWHRRLDQFAPSGSPTDQNDRFNQEDR